MQQHTTLVLVRHAIAADRDPDGELILCGQVDVPLTEPGHAQAAQLAKGIGRLGRFEAIYSSTLRRATQTVRPIAHALQLQPDAWSSLREISCGVLDGASVVHIKRAHADVWRANLAQNDDEFAWPGGETYQAFRSRVLHAIGRIAHMHHGGRVLVVTHAGVISQLLGWLHGEPAARWDVFRPRPASVTEVLWRRAQGSLLRFDDQSALR